MTQRVEKPCEAEIEYLETVQVEGQGIPTIALDYIPQQIQDIDLYLDFTLKGWGKDTTTNKMFCGAYNDNNNSTDYLLQRRGNLNNELIISWGSKGSSNYISCTLNKRSVLEIHGNSRKAILDGVEKTFNAFSTGKEPNTARFAVFSGNNTQSNGALWRLYSMKIVQEGEVLYDLIPFRKDGDGYLYNKITGKLYGNVEGNTGRFILGPDIA